MQRSTLSIIGNKVVLNIRERMCETAEEMLASEKFRQVLDHCLSNLRSKNSTLLEFFGGCTADEDCVSDLVKTLSLLVKYESNVVKAANAGEDYGNTFIAEGYVKREWTKNKFELIEIIPGGMRGWQDIVILRKN